MLPNNDNNPILRAFQNYGVRATAYCRRGDISTTFLMKMGESFLMTKTLLCRRIIKNNALLEKFRRSPRKMGRRRLATEWAGLSVTSKMAT